MDNNNIIFTKRQRFYVVLTAAFLLLTTTFIIETTSKYNKSKTEALKSRVQSKQGQNKTPELNIGDVNWISYSTSTTWGERDSHTAFTFNDRMWILGGLDANNSMENGEPNYDKAKYFNDVWYTDDGIKWIKGIEHANFPLIRSASVFEISGKLFLLGGYSPDPKVHYNTGLWTSLDGINWKKEDIILPWTKREGQKVIKFNDQYLMIGGVNYTTKQRFNDIWSSTDGYKWSLLTKNTAWEPRWDMEISVFNNKLWLTGGMTSVYKIFGDEWVSNDGINWALVYQDAPFGKRQGHTSIATNGNLILFGGIKDSNDHRGEIWWTNDGVKWKQQITNWTSREDHSSLLFKNRVWILGGMDYKYEWLNEIIHSDYRFFNGLTTNETGSDKNQNTVLYPGKCPTSSNKLSSDDLSKIFVNRNNRLDSGFIPGNLVDLDKIIKTDGGVCLDKLAAENLVNMFKQAETKNVFLAVNYGYRSPEKQQEMFNYWVGQSGIKEATEGIAKPYYSEHQLGVGVDLSGKSINYLGVSKKFAKTTEAEWLENNAYLYGYTLSYPEGKSLITGYIYEPWHYRYVGVETAKILHDEEITFSEYQDK